MQCNCWYRNVIGNAMHLLKERETSSGRGTEGEAGDSLAESRAKSSAHVK